MFPLLCWFMLICSNFSHAVVVATKCIDHERDALLQFKSGIESNTCGLLTSWTEQQHCCQWRGISCSNVTSHVTKLHLRGGDNYPCLVGKVDYSSLYKLSHLIYLDLSRNKFNQVIPISVDSFTNLKYLNLSKSGFIGDLPIQLGNLSKLQYLDLSSNSFAGHVPNSFSKLRSLRVLTLSNNNFYGVIAKTISNLCNLQDLDLSRNNFVDNISNVIQTISNMGCTNKPLLESLDLSWNQLWGSIPDMISSFSSMRVLHMNHNKLNGTISQGIGKLSKLEILSISDNSLEVTLNHSHFINLSNLHQLYLSNNPILKIELIDNWIPPFQLDIISLRSCKLGPDFPKWLMTQTNFSYLDVSNAWISGNISTSFWGESVLSKLEYLNMSNNMIHGMLPNLSMAFRIFAIDLSSNHFEGSIHSIVGSYALNYNDLTHFVCLNIQRNIEILDVSNNSLSGELPNCWMHIDQLRSLHLETNKFSGNIPTSFGSLKRLQYLHLQTNGFFGEVPASLKGCTSLVILDLAYNKFTGNISFAFENAYKNLSVLNLQGNNFFGTLPSSLCELSELQILELGHNNITGTIPKCVPNLAAMITEKSSNFSSLSLFDPNPRGTPFYVSYVESEAIQWKGAWRVFRITLQLVKAIDLSFNNLEGEIPKGISSLIGLVSLDLSRNRLKGSIPSDIGQLHSLELLDLSNNNLSGSIPLSLSSLPSLGFFNLSNNNLSGKIPELGTQISTFNISSTFGGNPLLVEQPLNEGRAKENNDNNRKSVVEDDKIDGYAAYFKSMGLGIVIGFWGVGGTIVLKKSWRRTVFRSWVT